MCADGGDDFRVTPVEDRSEPRLACRVDCEPRAGSQNDVVRLKFTRRGSLAAVAMRKNGEVMTPLKPV